jgi:monoamine oxidase
MGEIHDASGPDGCGALFGFLGVGAAQRAALPEGALLAACRAQLAHLFGEAAAHPLHEALQDWAREPFTATEADWHDAGHAHPPVATVDEGPWKGRLVGAASEWSPSFPGYVAGALEAAQHAVGALNGRLTAP